ncbi:MAG: hypothetical protein RRY34_01460, partial [Victivallaceae bacterium]
MNRKINFFILSLLAAVCLWSNGCNQNEELELQKAQERLKANKESWLSKADGEKKSFNNSKIEEEQIVSQF